MSIFSQDTFDWMAAISLNNSRDQFLELKPKYEKHVKQPFLELLKDLSTEFGGVPKVFRPNRDIRFSADKRPYKTNISGFLEGAGSTCYLDLSLDGLMAATGYYQMTKDQLVRYRAALTIGTGETTGQELRQIFAQTGAEGDGLKTFPRGFAKDHPNADLLRYTSLTCATTLRPDDVLGADVRAFAAEVWHRSVPLNDWLHAHVGPRDESF